MTKSFHSNDFLNPCRIFRYRVFTDTVRYRAVITPLPLSHYGGYCHITATSTDVTKKNFQGVWKHLSSLLYHTQMWKLNGTCWKFKSFQISARKTTTVWRLRSGRFPTSIPTIRPSNFYCQAIYLLCVMMPSNTPSLCRSELHLHSFTAHQSKHYGTPTEACPTS